jgi:hypothetical protein
LIRPLLQKDIAELEAAFAARKTDIDFLHALVDELSCRSTQRAARLKTRVEQVLTGLTRKVRTNYGFVANLEQAITQDIGIFSCTSWDAG